MEDPITNESETEITLLIEDQIFKVMREALVTFSDYFRAMFSGNYVETNQNEIVIDIVDANSMKIITQYMQNTSLNLSEIDLPVIDDLIVAANFLQVTKLLKDIEYSLEIRLNPSNCFEILDIAENAPFPKLLQYAVSFGLYSLERMKPIYIPTISKLFWYLSHPYLYARSELEVFKFGHEWISIAGMESDALMIVLNSLDFTRLTKDDLIEMKKIVKDYEDCLAIRVVKYMLTIVEDTNDLEGSIDASSESLVSLFSKSSRTTKGMDNEISNLVKESKRRQLKLIPAIPLHTPDDVEMGYTYIPHHLYTFDFEGGYQKWLQVAEENYDGWRITNWGPWKLIVVGGVRKGRFVRDLKIYDMLKKEWTNHDVKLPCRLNGNATVLEDSLYIIGGINNFGVCKSTVIYNLKERNLREIAAFPDSIHRPTICAHKGKIYASGQHYVYRYNDIGNTWEKLAEIEFRMDSAVSFKDNIYFTQNYFYYSYVFAFNPDIDNSMELILVFANPPAVCDLGSKLLLFTSSACDGDESKTQNVVEEYKASSRTEIPKTLWTQKGDLMVTDYACTFAVTVITEMAPLCNELSIYHKKYLDRYLDCMF